MIKKRKKSKEEIAQNKANIEAQNEFFLRIWRKRPHRCQSCNVYLGHSPKTYMFDHLLEKSKFPDYRFEEDNIFLCCLNCHDNKTRGFPSEKHKQAINEYIQIVNVNFMLKDL